MICPVCQGFGKVWGCLPVPALDGFAPVNMGEKPCPECNGSGIVHCCEGDCEQPEAI